MLGRVIFKKEYPRPVLEETEGGVGEKEIPALLNCSDGMDYLNRILEKTVYVLIPERREGRAVFIKESKNAADLYKLDIVITEYDSHITTALSVDYFVDVSELKEVILLADRVRFAVREEQVVLMLDYYTHATFRSGRRMPPFDL